MSKPEWAEKKSKWAQMSSNFNKIFASDAWSLLCYDYVMISKTA